MFTETNTLGTDLNPYLQHDIADWEVLRQRDDKMLETLAGHDRQAPRVYSEAAGTYFANSELAGLARSTYDHESLSRLEQTLHSHGTVHIPTVNGAVMVDGVRREVAMVAATEIGADGVNHGDMWSMVYLRDQVQVVSAYMKLALRNPEKYRDEGKTGQTLLTSLLHLMSTDSQLERFDTVIDLGSLAGQADWPQISLHFNDLEGKQPNGWRNIQDTVQMLAHETLEAIEHGFIEVDGLADSHKKFLASVVPLLKSVGYPHYGNSGSWEEIEAARTSVMSIETPLLHKIKVLTEKDDSLNFLKEGYAAGEFESTVDTMLLEGLHALGNRLPYESPEYVPDSVKFRMSDAALVYLLRYNVLQLLADYEIPVVANGGNPMSVQELEDMVLAQLETLFVAETNGMARYEGDSYQGENFHTGEAQVLISAVKSKVKNEAKRAGREVDLDEKQSLRGQVISSDKPAAWVHPLFQVASWAAGRSMSAREQGDSTGADRYLKIGTKYFNAGLSNVTGDNQWHAVLESDNQYHIKQVPAYRVPECYVAHRAPDGSVFYLPSPHTPLNWGTATLVESLGMFDECMRQDAAS